MKKDLLRYWKANSPEPRVDWPKKKKDFVFFAKSGSKKKKEAPVSFERKSDRRQTQQIVKTQVCRVNYGLGRWDKTCPDFGCGNRAWAIAKK